jgi:hypothetical protein
MGDTFSSSLSDDEDIEHMFEDMYRERQCAFVCAMAIANSIDMFIANELEGAVCQSMNPRAKVWEGLKNVVLYNEKVLTCIKSRDQCTIHNVLK